MQLNELGIEIKIFKGGLIYLKGLAKLIFSDLLVENNYNNLLLGDSDYISYITFENVILINNSALAYYFIEGSNLNFQTFGKFEIEDCASKLSMFFLTLSNCFISNIFIINKKINYKGNSFFYLQISNIIIFLLNEL